MNVNIHMLFDALDSGDARLVAEAKAGAPDIVGILPLSGGAQALDSEHLYVCAAEEVAPFIQESIPLHFAIVGEAAEDDLRAQGHSAIFFSKENSVLAVLGRLQCIKERFDDWDNELLAAIILHRPIKTVLELGTTLLTNPVAMFDKEFGLVATAGKLPANVSGSIWEPVLAKGYSPPSALSPRQRTQVRNRLQESDWPFVYYSASLEENHLCCSLFVSGVYFGSFGQSEFTSFTEGQISILACLARRMEQALENTFWESGTAVDIPYYIDRLLSGYIIDDNVIEYHLEQISWRSSDSFQVLRIEPDEKSGLSKEECAAYRNPLQAILPDSVIFQYENAVLVITRLDANGATHEALGVELDRLSLRAGVSMQFERFTHIKYAYIQSKEALLYGSGRLSYFEQCYSKCLYFSLGQITSLKSFCHPAILLEWERGDEKSRHLIGSMHAYLTNGRNLTDTAKKLNIHRNTLTYRLERIADLLGFDLNSDLINDELLTMLLTSCQIVNYLSEESVPPLK